MTFTHFYTKVISGLNSVSLVQLTKRLYGIRMRIKLLYKKRKLYIIRIVYGMRIICWMRIRIRLLCRTRILCKIWEYSVVYVREQDYYMEYEYEYISCTTYEYYAEYSLVHHQRVFCVNLIVLLNWDVGPILLLMK